MSDTDEIERDTWSRARRMTKDQKLELIREMKDQLMSGERQPLDANTRSAR
jgi:hypothetical protein